MHNTLKYVILYVSMYVRVCACARDQTSLSLPGADSGRRGEACMTRRPSERALPSGGAKCT